jgi:selenocysteine lyase/cysteine desulfurase
MRKVPVPAPHEDGEALAARVAGAITPRTKLLLISHVSAWNAEVLPVQAVAAAAQARGVAVLVDAAQSVGILDVDFAALGCDFLGASLHKAIGAPIASGVLLMRKEHIGRVEPLHPPSWDSPEYPMDRYEWSGAFQLAALATTGDAIRFQQEIGVSRKRARLRYLADRWQSRVRGLPRLKVLTPPAPSRSFGTAAVAIEGMSSRDLYERLRHGYGIGTQAKNGRHSPYTEAVRISPAAHASVDDVDRLADALTAIAKG